jgi:hypothetical protein
MDASAVSLLIRILKTDVVFDTPQSCFQLNEAKVIIFFKKGVVKF